MNFSDTMERYCALTEDALKKRMEALATYPQLHDAMAYSLFAGGKRIRPVMCLAGAEMLMHGGAQEALPAACAMEMIHTYSLIHDDLPAMDNDDFRRGKPSNHKAFGEANAILAGDGLLTYAFMALSELDNPEVVAAIAKGAMDMVAGQSLDLNPIEGADQLERIHALKTGALIVAAVLAGAHAAHASGRDCAALTDFAEHYGLLFQITDDILDVTGTSEQMGKTLGKDAAEGKITFVTCYGLEAAKKRAEEEARKAEEALLIFGARAAFFRELIRYTLTRTR